MAGTLTVTPKGVFILILIALIFLIFMGFISQIPPRLERRFSCAEMTQMARFMRIALSTTDMARGLPFLTLQRTSLFLETLLKTPTTLQLTSEWRVPLG